MEQIRQRCLRSTCNGEFVWIISCRSQWAPVNALLLTEGMSTWLLFSSNWPRSLSLSKRKASSSLISLSVESGWVGSEKKSIERNYQSTLSASTDGNTTCFVNNNIVVPLGLKQCVLILQVLYAHVQLFNLALCQRKCLWFFHVKKVKNKSGLYIPGKQCDPLPRQLIAASGAGSDRLVLGWRPCISRQLLIPTRSGIRLLWDW